MRVLFVNHFPLEGSGSGIYTQSVAKGVVRAGHEALTITPEHGEPAGFPFETRWIGFGPGRELPFNFPCFTTHPRSSTTFYELPDDAIRAYASAWRRAISSAVRDFAPDIVHAQHLWVASALAVETGLPVVATCHGTDLMGYDRDLRYHPFARTAAAGSARILAISSSVRQSVAARFPQTLERLVLVHNGFDEDLFRPDPAARARVFHEHELDPAKDRLAVFAGKFTRFKGVDVLLDAAAIYEKESPQIVTLLAGDGELRAELETRARSLSLSRVRFLGHQPQAALARLFAAADVAVFPSREEPFGLVAIEAMASGTPVVGTRAGGLVDFVTPDVGTLVALDDPAGLARAVGLESLAKATKGPVASRRAAERFGWPTRVAEILRVYHEALGT